MLCVPDLLKSLTCASAYAENASGVVQAAAAKPVAQAAHAAKTPAADAFAASSKPTLVNTPQSVRAAAGEPLSVLQGWLTPRLDAQAKAAAMTSWYYAGSKTSPAGATQSAETQATRKSTMEKLFH